MDNETIFINLVKNPDWKPGSNLPVYVGPPNTKYPDKNWRLGAKINGQYYNQAAFPAKDKEGKKIEGGLLVKLEPSKSSKKNDFASTSSSGKDEYTF